MTVARTMPDAALRTLHEQKFVKTFVRRDYRPRWLAMLEKPKRREKLLRLINNGCDLDSRNANRLPSDADAASIDKLLSDICANDTCYAMSDWNEIDGRIVSANEVLPTLVGWTLGTVLSLDPGRIAYVEFEGENERYILRHPPVEVSSKRHG